MWEVSGGPCSSNDVLSWNIAGPSEFDNGLSKNGLNVDKIHIIA